MSRVLALFYGLTSYAVFFGTFLYLIGFVGDLVVPRSVDAGGPAASLAEALVVNLLLIALFGVQHAVMARPGFKRWWTRIVPVPVERSTFVLVTSGILALMFWQWRPLPAVVWSVENEVLATVLQALAWGGWAMVLLSTFIIDHFDLFGLRQTFLFAMKKPYTAPPYKESFFYRWVRHPLMLGFLIAFWCTPTMTVGHLVCAGAFTICILISLQLEERDLVRWHGEDYEDYRRRVPMLVPFLRPRAKASVGDVRA